MAMELLFRVCVFVNAILIFTLWHKLERQRRANNAFARRPRSGAANVWITDAEAAQLTTRRGTTDPGETVD
jgi:hypothetical protein